MELKDFIDPYVKLTKIIKERPSSVDVGFTLEGKIIPLWFAKGRVEVMADDGEFIITSAVTSIFDKTSTKVYFTTQTSTYKLETI